LEPFPPILPSLVTMPRTIWVVGPAWGSHMDRCHLALDPRQSPPPPPPSWYWELAVPGALPPRPPHESSVPTSPPGSPNGPGGGKLGLRRLPGCVSQPHLPSRRNSFSCPNLPLCGAPSKRAAPSAEGATHLVEHALGPGAFRRARLLSPVVWRYPGWPAKRVRAPPVLPKTPSATSGPPPGPGPRASSRSRLRARSAPGAFRRARLLGSVVWRCPGWPAERVRAPPVLPKDSERYFRPPTRSRSPRKFSPSPSCRRRAASGGSRCRRWERRRGASQHRLR